MAAGAARPKGSAADSGAAFRMWAWSPATRRTILTICLRSRWRITGLSRRSTQGRGSPNYPLVRLPAHVMLLSRR